MKPTSSSHSAIHRFLSHWRNENNEAFDLIKSTVESIEDSFNSPTALIRPFSEPLKPQKFSDERLYYNSENSEVPSASTSYDSILKNNLSQMLSRENHINGHRNSDDSDKNIVGPPLQIKTHNDRFRQRLVNDESFESPLIKRRRNTLPYLELPTIKAFKTIEESTKTDASDVSESPLQEHSPQLQPKLSDKVESFSSSLGLCMLNFDDEAAQRSQKYSLSSIREKTSNVQFMQLELEEGLFSSEFIDNISVLWENCESLREAFGRLIEYIFCTKNLDESFFKSYPRLEIIYSMNVDSRLFLDPLKKAITALKIEDFRIRKDFNDEISFLETKFDKFIRQIGTTPETFRIFKGKLKIDEAELNRLHEKVFFILRKFPIKDRTKKALRDFILFTQKHINMLPSHHPVQDRAPHNSKITIEYVTVRKLLEKLTECHETILAQELLETVIFNYDHFISPPNLLLYLIKKYYTPRPLMMTFMEYRHFKTHQSSTTKQRIIDIVKFWLEERQGDFERNPDLLTLLITFIESVHKIEKETICKEDFKNACERVEIILRSIHNGQKKDEKQKCGRRGGRGRSTAFTLNLNSDNVSATPSNRLQSILKVSRFRSGHSLYKKIPLAGDENFLMAWDSKEIAKQLTLIDHKLFSKIDLYEMLKKRWNRSEFSYECFNVTTAIRRFNSLSFWVQYVILYQDKDEERYELLAKFLSIAAHCLEFYNYNTAHAIYAALLPLNANGIWNSSTTIELDFAKLQDVFKSETFFQDMDKEYRRIDGPAVPSISYFTKVFFKLQDNVNFFARFEGPEKYLRSCMLSQIADCSKLMRKFQKAPFDFNKNETMYNFLKKDYKLKDDINFDSEDAEEILRNKMMEVKQTVEFPLLSFGDLDSEALNTTKVEAPAIKRL